MRHHPKVYEDVFSSDVPTNKEKLKIEKLIIRDMGVDIYTSYFHDFLQNFYSRLFLDCVKLSWLRRKFGYSGMRMRVPIYKNSPLLQNIFTKFLRRHVKNDIQIITKGKFFQKLETYYFDVLFPGFDDGNPFENPNYYSFPFKNISMEFLLVVYQMDDRMFLLKEADENKMSYANFLDYVLNHILSENVIIGRDRYVLKQNQDRSSPYFVRDLDKIFKPVKGMKRT